SVTSQGTNNSNGVLASNLSTVVDVHKIITHSNNHNFTRPIVLIGVIDVKFEVNCLPSTQRRFTFGSSGLHVDSQFNRPRNTAEDGSTITTSRIISVFFFLSFFSQIPTEQTKNFGIVSFSRSEATRKYRHLQ